MSLSLTLSIPDQLNTEHRQVRMSGTRENPLFCLADLCKALGIENSRRVSREMLDTDDVRQAYIIDSLGRQQEATFATEAGFYTVVLRSDKSQAKPFRKWVCGEVLPCIRKHGCYPAPPPIAHPVPREPLETVRGFLHTVTHVLGLGGMEDRDRILLKDWARNRLLLDGAETATPSTRFVTIPERCVELGYPRPRRGQDSEIGKCVAAHYRRKHGQEPSKHQQTVDGRAVRVNTYTETDLDVVDAGIRDYHQLQLRLTGPGSN